MRKHVQSVMLFLVTIPAVLLAMATRRGLEWDGFWGGFAAWAVALLAAFGVNYLAELLGILEFPPKTIPQRLREWWQTRRARRASDLR